MALPDKHIRKAIYAAINDISVSGSTIPVYDYRVTTNTLPTAYILMSTQTGTLDTFDKCGESWQSSILLDVVTKYAGVGNTGSRLFADDIADAIIPFLKVLQLDIASGLQIYDRNIFFENDQSIVTDKENIFRKLIRVELRIN